MKEQMMKKGEKNLDIVSGGTKSVQGRKSVPQKNLITNILERTIMDSRRRNFI